MTGEERGEIGNVTSSPQFAALSAVLGFQLGACSTPPALCCQAEKDAPFRVACVLVHGRRVGAED